MPYLDVQQLEKSFGDRQALAGMSFAVDRGEVYGLVGPNGAGKTTTINVICSLLEQEAGRVTLDDTPLDDSMRSQIGVVPQEIALYRDLTSTQNLEFFAGLYGLRGAVRTDRVLVCLEAVGLEDRAASIASDLSGGMQRRLHIAVTMLHEPPLMILDEPTVGLDLAARHRVWDVIRGLRSEGRAILLTTHHLQEAEVLSSRIGIVAAGRVVAEGTMDELRALIPAAELAVVESDDPAAVLRQAEQRGLTYRDAGARVTVWLPRKTELEEVAGYFRGIQLTSLSLKPVGLEEVYAETVKG